MRLKSEVLILQLVCHCEIEKQQLTVDSGNSNLETAAAAGKRMPLKSHMKNKAQRIPEFRKAVARFCAKGETKEGAYELLNGLLETNKQGREDHLYESDNDDLKFIFLFTYSTYLSVAVLFWTR